MFLKLPLKFGKIELVTADIFLIWINDDWTNITITVGISLVNSGSVTAEIFLIWTNVPRTNVAWGRVH